ncbi:hypothetical protein [Pseudonocardia hydrocarbonoxydans]
MSFLCRSTLEELTTMAHVTGTTINDVCLAVVAGAVARYLRP